MTTVLLASLAAFVPVVRAGAVIVVDTVARELNVAGCSFAEAILTANQDRSVVYFDAGPPHAPEFIDTGCAAGSGDDVILLGGLAFEMRSPFRNPDNHTGAAGLPVITSTITIEGAGAVLTRRSESYFRALAVGPTGNLDLREVHVRGFAVRGGDGADGGGGGMGAGGAILVDDGALRVQWSTFEANEAIGGNGSGFLDPDARGGGGGGGGLAGDGGYGSTGGGGGGGGGSRGSGETAVARSGGPGGGTLLDGGSPTDLFVGGYKCGGGGNDATNADFADGWDASCPGGGGGGGTDGLILTGNGGAGAFGGGGGGGAAPDGNGGDGGEIGGGGGAAGISDGSDGGSGGGGGFGGGGGAGPGGSVFGGPGDGGTFAGSGGDIAGGGGAGLGGAIFGFRANIIVSNSTFTSNAAVRGESGGAGAGRGTDAGGAIFAVGGSLTVVNSTIAGNATTGNGAGVTVYRPDTGEATRLHMANTIIANNTGHDECFVRGGVTVSGTSNLGTPHLDDDETPCPDVDETEDLQLGSLQLNSPGRTPTMAIPATSPAVDAADPASAPLDDQRGVGRPQFDGPDIGAYELAELALPVDTLAPSASPVQSPAANGDGWNQGQVTVTWAWADSGGSGIDYRGCPLSSTSSDEGADLLLTATCFDLAGNVASASWTVSIDRTAPTATCASTRIYTIGGDHSSNVTATVVDLLSGPVEGTVSADVTQDDIATPGIRSKAMTGSDLAGNQTSFDCPYVVAYAFLGYLEPIPQSAHKRGATIPVRFRLGDADGRLSDADAAALASACLVAVTLDGRIAGCAGYDAASDSFQFDLKLARNLVAGTHTIGIRVSASGGVVNDETVSISVKK